MSVSVALQSTPLNFAESCFHSTDNNYDQHDHEDESELLKSLRNVFAPNQSSTTAIRHVLGPSPISDEGEEGLSWSGRTVVWSVGGIPRRKWDFSHEGQDIQWACWAWFRPDDVAPTHASHHPSTRPDDNTTFGPFFQFLQRQRMTAPQDEQAPQSSTACRALVVFLRDIAKVLLRTGVEHTINLPFLVRRAWDIAPTGLLVQRAQDCEELNEASLLGTPLLPTLFSLSSPLDEFKIVGCARSIIGGFSNSDAHPIIEPLPSARLHPSDTVVFVSSNSDPESERLLVSHNHQKRRLTLWRYALRKPVVSLHASDRDRGAKTRERVLNDRLDRIPLDSEDSPMPAPYTAANLSMPHLPPMSRGDLSSTMDRIHLGGHEADEAAGGVGDSSMRPHVWLQHVMHMDLSDHDSHHAAQITIHPFDTRGDTSTVAVLLPSQNIHLLSLTRQHSSIASSLLASFPARAATSLVVTRAGIRDLVIITPDGSIKIILWDLRELNVALIPPTGIKAHSLRNNSISFAHSRSNSLASMHIASPTPSPLSSPQNTSDLSPLSRKPIGFADPAHSSLTILFDDGSCSRASFDLTPTDWVVRLGFEALARVVPKEEGWAVRRRWLEKRGKSGRTEFECFSDAVCETFVGVESTQSEQGTVDSAWEVLSQSRTHTRIRDEQMFTAIGLALPEPNPLALLSSKAPVTVPSTSPTSPHLAPAMLALHLAAQTLVADVTKMDRLADMGGLVLRLAKRVRADYVDYWSRMCCDDEGAWRECVGNEPYLHDERILAPPDILSHLYTRLAVPHGRTSFPRLSELARKFELSPALQYGRRDPMTRIHLWNDVFNILCDAAVGDQRARAVGVVSALLAAGNGDGDEEREQKTECQGASVIARAVARLPIGIGAPIREALRSCQLNPPSEMSAGTYALIERRDLAHMRSGKASGFTFGGAYEHRARMDTNPDARATADELEREAKAIAQGHTWEHSGTELGLKGFTDVRFGNDQRLREVEQMLSASRVVVIKLKDRPELSEHDQAAENQQVAHCIAERTFSLAFGRGAYTFGSVPSVMTDVYTIPKIELSVKMYPQNITVMPEPNRIPPDCFQFANFHNGVAAALRISPSSGSVDSSWIAFNRPNDLTAEHAGFLYGLGLTGHLRSMVTWHTFRYLTPKHELTSMGVLLGLAAAHMGTADKATTKLLCVHIPALLPPRAAELNIPHATQIAALSGVGLLYLGTRDRRMAEVMLGEIGKSNGQDAEAYAVSAALSFGMVMLGMGARATSPVDMEMLARLRVLIQGEPARSGASAAPGEKPSFDVNVTSPAATVALALMYLRTGRADIADLLELPDTPMALYRIQPNLLLVRTLGRALIMWDEIKPSLDWVQDRLPTMGTERLDRSLNESVDLAHYHIIAGCCFAIGLKYAGTTDEKAYGVIAYWFDFFTKHITLPTVTYEGQVKRSAMRETLNILALALAMVMAGTGELTTLRRLRVAYGRFGPGFKFGSPMSTSLALGLLFLGGGRYTLSSSNASVACLVAAFYPRLPLTSADNRGHLQLLRHLWVLATEPRCLVARDADTGETVYLPVKVKVAANPPILHHLMTPTLIPDVRALQSIRVDSPRYWPYYVDVAGVRAHRENILHHQTLFVKRRTGFLSYMEDPRGVRSIFVRAGAHASEPSALDFPASAGLKGVGAQKDLHRFIVSFSNEPMFVAWADRLCRSPENPTRADAARRTYFHQALLECLTADKAQALPLHAGLHALTQTGVDLYFPHSNSSHPNHPFETSRLPLAGHHTTPGPRTLVFRDVRLARDFYAQLFPNFGGRVGEKARGGLVKGSLLSAVAGAWDGVLREAKGGRVQNYTPDTDLGGYVGVNALDLNAAVLRYCRGEDVRPHAPRRSGWMQRERELLRALGFYLSRFCFPSPDALRGIRVLVEEERAKMMKEKKMAKQATEADKLNAVATREQVLMLLAASAATGLHGYMPIQDEYHPRWAEDCWKAWGWMRFTVFVD